MKALRTTAVALSLAAASLSGWVAASVWTVADPVFAEAVVIDGTQMEAAP